MASITVEDVERGAIDFSDIALRSGSAPTRWQRP
jgi:hypothetical protein